MKYPYKLILWQQISKFKQKTYWRNALKGRINYYNITLLLIGKSCLPFMDKWTLKIEPFNVI